MIKYSKLGDVSNGSDGRGKAELFQVVRARIIDSIR